MMRTITKALIAVLFLFSCKVQDERPAPAGGVISENGMVVSASPYASEVGLHILEMGGNAFDAAIAMQYALAVAYPFAGNIGGGGFMVYRTVDGETGTLDFRETAPLASHRNMYLDGDGNVIENLSRTGHLAAGVPGTPAGMEEVFDRFGSLPFEELINPAIGLAEDGFVLTSFLAEQFNRFRDEFKEANTVHPFILKDEPWQAGDLFVSTDLAGTLKRIRESGAAGFYEGETARLIVAEMQRGGGIITHEDLQSYRAVWREPITVPFREYTIITMGPPSSGGIAIGQLLTGSLDYRFREWGHNSALGIHVMAELKRRVYADRATWLGDSDYVDVPARLLLDPEYLANRNSTIDLDRATPSSEIKEGDVERIESFETTHFSVVDRFGNAVSLTTTINSFFGNKVVVGGAGFFLNNEMDDFSIKPGHPNQFGLIGAEANAIEPGKRMLSSMTPTIVEKNGDLYFVLGTPGGSTIITNVYQTIMNVLEHEMGIQDAVNAKKIHAQWLPDEIVIERGAESDEVRKVLESKGHSLREIPQIGRMQAIMVLPDGRLEGAADITRTGDSTALGH